MTLRNTALATAVALFAAISSYAQITAIEGEVKGEDGKPLQGAVVKIHRTDIKGDYNCKTDKKGHYFYNGLPLGMYNVSLEIGGKQADVVNGVRTRLGDPTAINFDLASRAKEHAATMKAAETGQLTKEMERGLSAEQKAALEKATKEREASMKKNKELNDAFNAGMAAMQAKQYDQAIASLAKAGEIDPNQPAVWAQLGDAYMGFSGTKTGAEFDANAQKALEAYSKAIALKPDDPATHNNYALALAKAKKFPEMEAELKKAADLDPPNGGKYYYNLGALLVNSGQSEAAGEAFKKAIELTPNYADAYYQYGVTLVSKAAIGSDGKVTPVPGTVEAFQKYLELQPQGQFAQSAQEMLTTLGSSVQTKFQNPNAKQETKKTTTKKK